MNFSVTIRSSDHSITNSVFSIIDLFNPNARYGLKLSTFNLNQVVESSSVIYLGARKVEEIGDYGKSIFKRSLSLHCSMDCFLSPDGNVSVQKKFVRKEFNFGLQERLTGTDMPVEESDFKAEPMHSNNSNIKCVREEN